MPGIDWKNETAKAQNFRFWQEKKNHYFDLGFASHETDVCPYVETSFAALQWQRGRAARKGNE